MPKILLVEDNEMNRDMLTRRLERKGFEIVHAVDGLEAVQQALRLRPQLILMDMNLPLLDGWDATRQIRKSAPDWKVPIIALTAHALSHDRDKAIEAGCTDYDSKPVDFARLLGKIENALRQSEGSS